MTVFLFSQNATLHIGYVNDILHNGGFRKWVSKVLIGRAVTCPHGHFIF